MGNNIFIIFSRNTQQNTTKLGTFVNVICLQLPFQLSSRLIVERHLPLIASDAYGIGFVEETRITRDQYCGCIAKVSDRKQLYYKMWSNKG
jgi:hypothetical protein